MGGSRFRNTIYQAGQLDAQFRAAIMKLQMIETRLGPVPTGKNLKYLQNRFLTNRCEQAVLLQFNWS